MINYTKNDRFINQNVSYNDMYLVNTEDKLQIFFQVAINYSFVCWSTMAFYSELMLLGIWRK